MDKKLKVSVFDQFLANKPKWITMILIVAIVALIPTFIHKISLMNVFILILLGGFQAMCWNLMSGLTGCFSMGHAAFYGLGAYTVAVLYGDLGISPIIGMVIGGVVAAVAGFIMGMASLRLKSHFFGLATMAFVEIMAGIFNATKEIFGLKPNGAQGYMIPTEYGVGTLQFENKAGYYYLILIMLVIITIVTLIIMKSKLGYFGKAIKDNQNAAESVGVKTTATKVIIVCISAFLTAFAGGFYVVFMHYIEPGIVFNFDISVNMICYSVMGGVGTLFGPLLGAALLVPLQEIIRNLLGASWQGLHVVIYGILTIVVLILLPDGILGGIKRAIKRINRSSTKQQEKSPEMIPEELPKIEGGAENDQ